MPVSHGPAGVPGQGPDPFAPPASQQFYTPQPNVLAAVTPVYTGTAPAGTQLFYSSAQFQTVVIADNGSTLEIGAITGLPTLYPFKLLLEWGTANQEIVIITSAPSGNGPYTFTGVLRGYDGGGPQIAHSAGAQVNHGVSAADFYGTAPVYNPCDTQYAGGADPTGTIDSTAAINAAIVACGQAGGGIVSLPPGTFACKGAIVINYNYVTLTGAGWNNATSLTYIPGAPRLAAIVVGEYTYVTGSNVLNLSINAGTQGAANIGDSSNVIQSGSGHGIVFVSETGLIQNVTVTYAADDGFHIAQDNVLSPTSIYDVTMYNCYSYFVGGYGHTVDSTFSDCEFTTVKCSGGNAFASPTGNCGFNMQGTEIKYLNCHAYNWPNYGAVIGNGAGSESVSIIGGEWETNTTGGVCVLGSVPVSQVKIIGADFYSNGTYDLNIQSATGVTVSGCLLSSSASYGIYTNGSTGIVLSDNIIDNSSGYTSGAIFIAAGSSECEIHGNYINSSNSAAAVTISNSTYTDISGNMINNVYGVTEEGSANYNRWYNNIMGGLSYAPQASGANSVQYLNTGANAQSTVTIQQANFAALSAVTVTAASITSLGSMTIPLYEVPTLGGAAYHFTLNGTLGTASSAPTFILDVRWGGTGGTEIMSVQSTATANAPALAASLSARPVIIEGMVEFVTSGTCVGWLRMQWLNSATATTAANWVTAFTSITSPVTVTTTSSEALTVDWTWSATGAGTTITIASSVFERVA